MKLIATVKTTWKKKKKENISIQTDSPWKWLATNSRFSLLQLFYCRNYDVKMKWKKIERKMEYWKMQCGMWNAKRIQTVRSTKMLNTKLLSHSLCARLEQATCALHCAGNKFRVRRWCWRCFHCIIVITFISVDVIFDRIESTRPLLIWNELTCARKCLSARRCVGGETFRITHIIRLRGPALLRTCLRADNIFFFVFISIRRRRRRRRSYDERIQFEFECLNAYQA